MSVYIIAPVRGSLTLPHIQASALQLRAYGTARLLQYVRFTDLRRYFCTSTRTHTHIYKPFPPLLPQRATISPAVLPLDSRTSAKPSELC